MKESTPVQYSTQPQDILASRVAGATAYLPIGGAARTFADNARAQHKSSLDNMYFRRDNPKDFGEQPPPTELELAEEREAKDPLNDEMRGGVVFDDKDIQRHEGGHLIASNAGHNVSSSTTWLQDIYERMQGDRKPIRSSWLGGNRGSAEQLARGGKTVYPESNPHEFASTAIGLQDYAKKNMGKRIENDQDYQQFLELIKKVPNDKLPGDVARFKNWSETVEKKPFAYQGSGETQTRAGALQQDIDKIKVNYEQALKIGNEEQVARLKMALRAKQKELAPLLPGYTKDRARTFHDTYKHILPGFAKNQQNINEKTAVCRRHALSMVLDILNP